MEEWEHGLGDGHYMTAHQMFTPVEGGALTQAQIQYNAAISLYRGRHEWVNSQIKRGHAFHTPFRHRCELAVAVCNFACEMTAVWLRMCPHQVDQLIGPWSHGPPVCEQKHAFCECHMRKSACPACLFFFPFDGAVLVAISAINDKYAQIGKIR